MRDFFLEKITGFLDDPSMVLDAEEVIKIWDIFYTFADEVGEEGEATLRKTLTKIPNASQREIQRWKDIITGLSIKDKNPISLKHI